MTSVNVIKVVKSVVVTKQNGATVIVNQPKVSTVKIVKEGPQGPTGGAAFVYTQTVPATTWTINHNLGYRPSVELIDSGSQEIDGEVAHPSVNQTVVTLNPASAGAARLI